MLGYFQNSGIAKLVSLLVTQMQVYDRHWLPNLAPAIDHLCKRGWKILNFEFCVPKDIYKNGQRNV